MIQNAVPSGCAALLQLSDRLRTVCGQCQVIVLEFENELDLDPDPLSEVH